MLVGDLWRLKANPIKNHSKQKIVPLSATIILLLLCFYHYFFRAHLYHFSGSIMGTQYQVQVFLQRWKLQPKTIEQGILNHLRHIDQLMSTYKLDSEVSKLNQLSVGETKILSQETCAVMALSLALSQRTNGAFDVTVGSVVNLWGFGPEIKHHVKPENKAVDSALKQVGYQLLDFDKTTCHIKKLASVYVDLSAVAKGYAIDYVVSYLKQQKVSRFLVELGGELWAQGEKYPGKPWRVAIEAPTDSAIAAPKVQRTITLNGKGVATSGDYRNYFVIEYDRYTHVLNPKSGQPIQHGLASVTVIADTSAAADAWATALMVLGPEQGWAKAETEQLAAFFLLTTEHGFEERYTKAFKPYLNSK